MSHLVSPNAYRLGRTQLWANTEAVILNNLLWRSQLCYTIGLVGHGSVNFSRSCYLLFYPVFFIYRYRNRFLYPRFYRHIKFLVWVNTLVFQQAEAALLAIWTRSLYRFSNRFTIRRKRTEWREWFKFAMVRGVGIYSPILPLTISGREWGVAGRRRLGGDQILEHLLKLAAISSSAAHGYFRSIYYKASIRSKAVFWRHYYRYSLRRLPVVIAAIVYSLRVTEPGWLKSLRSEVYSAARVTGFSDNKAPTSKRRPVFEAESSVKTLVRSKYMISNALLSALVSKELRYSVKVQAMNIFNYMFVKKIVTPVSYMGHLDYLISRRTSRDQHTYKTYFDILNILFLQVKFTNIEWVFLRVMKYALFKMHKRNIKLKYFLRFVHNAIQALGQSNREFSVFRLVVHGKIRGGTHRTKAFTAGYGKPPLNSIGFNMKYCFDNIYSKYGEYGMHLVIGRRVHVN